MSQQLQVMSGTMFASGTFVNSTPVVISCTSLGIYFSAWLRYSGLTTQKIEYSLDLGVNWAELGYIVNTATYKEISNSQNFLTAYTHLRFTGVAGNTYGIVN